MSPPFRPGAILANKYRIESRLGDGGMGTVLGAVNVPLEQRVAIKLLNAYAQADEVIVARFMREGRAAARLRSEHIARVLDFGMLDNGQPFLVTERLDGLDLARLAASKRPLDPAEVVDYLVQACNGLAEAHAAGIVHRDLKPANLFLTETVSGRPLVKILDFGICKLEERAQPSITKANDLLGTPRYMAPEQFRGARDVDARADIWALGVIAYELLAGRPPFDGNRVSALLNAIMTSTPTPLYQLRGDVSKELSDVVMRCLAKKKEDRWQDVLSLSFALAPHGLGRRPSTPLRVVGSGAASDSGAASGEGPLDETSAATVTSSSAAEDEDASDTPLRVADDRPPTMRLPDDPPPAGPAPGPAAPAAITPTLLSASDPPVRPPVSTPVLVNVTPSAPAMPASDAPVRRFGRYFMCGPLASGGMASVFYGAARNDDGTLHPVALKRLRAELTDPRYATMLVDEARITSRIRHPNVVQTLDVIALEGDTILAMEYVSGVSLSEALRAASARGVKVPIPIAAAVAVDVLSGLHAAHVARDMLDQPLEIVHRDVSPQNILLDEHGRARIADFGVALARGRLQKTTETGALKGKLGYLAPEQVHGQASRAVDLYACGAVLWEMLAGRPLFSGSEGEILAATLLGKVDAPSTHAPEVPPALDAVVLKALSRSPEDREPSAAAMAESVAAATRVATEAEIAEWLDGVVGTEIRRRRAVVEEMLNGVATADASSEAPVAVSAAGGAGTAARARGARTWLVVPFGLAVVAAMAAVVAARSGDEAAVPAITAAPASAATPTTPVTPATSEPPPAPPEASSGVTVAPERPAASAARATSPPSKGSPVHRARPRPSSKTPDCSVPYTIDSAGVTVWRRECFKK